MRLEGSCHCQAVSFSLESETPYPFMQCFCDVCRKTGGGGGYAINVGGHMQTLKVTGAEHISVFHATLRVASGEPVQSPAERRFCKKCGTALWLWDPRYPDLVHPLASAIDTPLPTPPQIVQIMLERAPQWVKDTAASRGRQQLPAVKHGAYPPDSLVDWHRKQGLLPGAQSSEQARQEGPLHDAT